ncbi:MAG: DUF1724 domain-containing protein [Methanobacteriaceae archaeon]|jgi:predicted transcriptional regulator|nr:DUF1724 domain-containing protein [Candidatus Methanorudis spinitermitis]
MHEKNTSIENLNFTEPLIYFNEFSYIRHILSSTMRTKLLLSLYNNKKKLATLRDDLKKPSATILHGIKELEKNSLIKKFDKYYSLSSTGYILAVNLIKLIEKWYSIGHNIDFWKNQDISAIPSQYLKEIGIFQNPEYIISDENDLIKPLNEYIKLISKSNKLKIALPIFSKVHLDAIVHKLDNNCDIELIIDENIFESINSNGYRKKLFKNSNYNEKRNNLKIWKVKENLNLFLTVCEDFLSLSLFFEDGSYNDSKILLDKSEKAIDWGLSLFNHYKEIASPLMLFDLKLIKKE